MKFLKNTYSTLFASMALAVAAVGCSDELDYPHSTVEPGLPATISVNVSLPEMTPITRADIQNNLDNKVESLWIGVYSEKGVRTNDGYEVPAEYLVNTETHKGVTLKNIPAKTGNSYIVAVANYKNRNCLDANGKLMSYLDALKDADTLEKFKGISAIFDDNGNVDLSVPKDVLLMSGHYIGGTHSDGSYTDPEMVEITKETTLTGSIHLRRLVSQVKFEVTYDTTNIGDFKIVSYQVKNVPNQSWLYERSKSTENASEDSGNVAKSSVNVGDDDDRTLGELGSYQTSSLYTQINQNGNTWSFDWWQYENKRTGRDNVTGYNHREKEYKKSDGTNSGVYESLVDNINSTNPNNNATLVEMKVKMTMLKNETGGDLQGGKRTVEATYTIHLGYCEGEDAAKARDFNCRRNAKYTYKVNIKNVNDIIVEATSDLEKAPGAEGIVTDVESKYVELDAHYSVYNIYLPSAPAGDFHYIIRCYDANSNLITYDSQNPTNVDEKYKDWIKIKKTSKKGALATFKNETSNPLYSLEKFKENAITEGWYTVFFNEYVYEDANGGTSNWKDYVNKENRQVWLSVSEATSSDKESVKYSSQYTFSQKSIQTFYGSGDSALGMEHDNESYGLNMRNSFNTTSKGINKDNGRYNTAVYVSGSTDKNLAWADNQYSWNTYVNFESYQEVHAINNINVGVTDIPARNADSDNPIALPSLKSYTGTATPSSYDPDQTSKRKYIEAINACMNRNRDLDGDGKIDKDELRWYVPTTNQYNQIIIGSASLKQPILDYSKHKNIKEDNAVNMNLFIYGSNGEVIWLMEGFSTSTWKSGSENAEYAKGAPWEIRCVRNLGTKNYDIESGKEVQDAYVLDEDTQTIRMTYYDSKSIRGGKIPKMYPHSIADNEWNSVSKAFQYKSETTSLNGYPIPDSDEQWEGYKKGQTWYDWLNNSNPCDVYNTGGETGWRVPNQKEIMILMMSGDIVTHGRRIFDTSATFAHYNDKGSSYSDSFEDFNVMVVRRDGLGNYDPIEDNYGVAAGTQQPYSEGHYLRCVKDVD